MEIPTESIVNRIENNEILILDADNPYVAVSNLLYRNQVLEIIKAQALEIRDLQTTICRLKDEYRISSDLRELEARDG
tara:strand:+ start:452 stop:685 length:234 start_codon:yes stop_codon:yes gene_type:complete